MPLSPQPSVPQHRCLERDRLVHFAQGRLSRKEIERVAAEVDSCQQCQAALEALDGEQDALLETLLHTGKDTEPIDSPQLDDLLVAAELAGVESLSQAGGAQPQLDDGEALAAPRIIGPYRLLQRLGSGGMGTVYVAEHAQLRRRVALKILAEHRPQDAAARARFAREMEAIGRLDHPHIVRAVDAGEAEGQQFLAMELLAGEDTAQLVRREGPLPVREACRIIRQACEAIDFAHQQGLLHRDIKPSNLLLTTSGEVKVLDLGLARSSVPGDGDDAGLTSASHMLGTGDYVAPEQGLDPRAADEQSDVYSLGCTLFFLLTGQPPFADGKLNTFTKKVMAHVHESPPPASSLRDEIEDGLDAVMARALAKHPEDRYGSAAAMAAALSPFCRTPAIEPAPLAETMEASAVRRGLWTTPVLLALGGGMLSALLLGMFIGAYPWLNQAASARKDEGNSPAPPATDGDAVLRDLDAQNREGGTQPEDAGGANVTISSPPQEHSDVAATPRLDQPLDLGWVYKQHDGDKRTPTAMLVHGQGFGFLSAVQGKFHGWAEKVNVGVGDDNVWGVSGAGVEFGVDIKARGYGVETRAHAPLSIAVGGFHWTPPSDAVRMLHKDEGICVLSSIQGGLQKPENYLGIEQRDDGYYWLSGVSNDKQARVTATGVLLSRGRTLNAEVKEYNWRPGQEPIKMIPADEGLCFLSMLGGSWSTPADAAGVYVNQDDGHWYLAGGGEKSTSFARALAVRYFGEPQE